MSLLRTPCADIEDGKNCNKVGGSACKGCGLVKYCSRACHKTDWKRHKKLCKSDLAKAAWVPRWTRQGRQPTFSFESAQHYHSIPGKKDVRHLWGNTPAMDLLQLRKNEGLPYEQDLEICFAACGDLRNVIKTVACSHFTKFLAVHINDVDEAVTSRNVVLIILLAFHDNDQDMNDQALTDCAIHLWYSAYLTASHIEVLHMIVRPLLVKTLAGYEKPESTDQGVMHKIVLGKIILHVPPKVLKDTIKMLDATLNKTSAELSRRAIVFGRPDRNDRTYFRYREGLHRRCSIAYFKETGILLPLGASTAGYDFPNPTLFDDNATWLPFDSLDPLAGWSSSWLEEHRADWSTPTSRLPEYDLYGTLHHVVGAYIKMFRYRVKTIICVVYNMDLLHLHKKITPGTLDRLDLSNVLDNLSIDTRQTLAMCRTLLRLSNPRATVVGLLTKGARSFQGARDLRAAQAGRFLLTPLNESKTEANKFLQAHVKPKQTVMDWQDPAIDRLIFAGDFFDPLDEILDNYMQMRRFAEHSESSGLTIKHQHTIAPKWMFEIAKHGEPGAEGKFEALLTSPNFGEERSVEWMLTSSLPTLASLRIDSDLRESKDSRKENEQTQERDWKTQTKDKQASSQGEQTVKDTT